jgi:putative phosphoribosyl transferase
MPSDLDHALEQPVVIPSGRVRLDGDLAVPTHPRGLVLFAHGSGSSRRSPRNRMVARRLHNARVGTLLFDLLTEPESAARSNVFDIGLLASRLLTATTWVSDREELHALPLGYFGASTGAAAALVAAAQSSTKPKAVVSRGGRPDLAGDYLPQVTAPTLLLVGGNDPTVLQLNRWALERLHAEAELVVVPGAGHLFEEPGTLEEVARLAEGWFARYLVGP